MLTVDLPRLFVRPKKIVLDFQKGKSLGPVSDDFNNSTVQKGDNKDFAGELSITLVDARKVPYAFFGNDFSFTSSHVNLGIFYLSKLKDVLSIDLLFLMFFFQRFLIGFLKYLSIAMKSIP